MLEVIKNNQGDIQAVCEFNRVNPSGRLDNYGRYIYIANIEVNENLRYNGMVKRIMRKITDRESDFDFIYFQREKYNDRIRIYTKTQWLSRIKEQ